MLFDYMKVLVHISSTTHPGKVLQRFCWPKALNTRISSCSMWYKKSKNISIKMLKDVGMTVPKSRETRTVYICSNAGDEGSIYICSKIGDEGINNNKMRNPIIKEM